MKNKGISVLIVDDNGYYVNRMVTMLDNLGHIENIHTAGNCREAYSSLTTQKHDFILLDINLPDGSGIDLLQEIKDKNQDCEIIMISNQIDSYYETKCKKLGAKYFLDKTNDFDKVPELLVAMNN